MPAAIVRVRIGVVKDGITVIAPGDLASAGLNPAAMDPRTFAMTSLGKSVAIYVDNQDPAGTFEGNDRLYFFGEKFRGPEMDQKYTDERVYWLESGGTPGPRIETAGAPQGTPAPAPLDFATTVRAEESMVWFPLHTLTLDTEDTWYWARLQPGVSPSVTQRLSYDIPSPAAGFPATLRLEEVSKGGKSNVNPDHHTTAVLNEQPVPILDAMWDGPYVRQLFTVDVPANVLRDGSNDLDVTASTAPGTWGDEVYVNYWDVTYRRLFQARQDQLDFQAETTGPQEYAAGGFTSTEVWAWDVTDTVTPRIIPATTAADGSVRFATDAISGNRYWLQGKSSLQGPASIRERLETGLRNPPGGADAVIVTSKDLLEQARSLAQWHADHGRRALVVDFQDACDEFNDGIYHPKAVQAMMKWAATNWEGTPPSYLTLFGDGHWNFKNYNPSKYPGGPNPVPPYLAFTDPWMGEAPDDALYGDLNDDKLPEVAVGRIAVNTPEEAATVVAKIRNYDEGLRLADWQRRAIFVADAPDPAAGDFEAITEQIIAAYTPLDLTPARVYRKSRTAPVEDVRRQLLDELNAGAFMVQYTGHGAIWYWADSLLSGAEIGTLSNGTRLPIVLTFNCLDGNFAYTGAPGIEELMQRKAGGGSIAAISPTGLGLTPDQVAFRKILLTVMFTRERPRDRKGADDRAAAV